MPFNNDIENRASSDRAMQNVYEEPTRHKTAQQANRNLSENPTCHGQGTPSENCGSSDRDMHRVYEKPSSHIAARQVNGDLSENPTCFGRKRYTEPCAKDQSHQVNGDVSSVELAKVFFAPPYQQELPRGAYVFSAQATYTEVP